MQIADYAVGSKTGGKPVTRRTAAIIIGGLLIITALLCAGCNDKDEDTPAAAPPKAPAAASVPSKGLIKADPNPVPAGPTDLGKTKVSWDTKSDLGPVDIYVSTNGEPEVQFAAGGPQGSQQAPWIQPNSVYDFRLYVGTGANKQLLDHVEVTRSK